MDLPEPSSPSTAIKRPGKLVSANVLMSLAAESYDETRLRPIPFSWRRLLGGVGGALSLVVRICALRLCGLIAIVRP